MGWVQWRGTVGRVEGWGGGVRWRGPVVAVEGCGGYCGGIEWGPTGEYAHTMLKTHKMCYRRTHVCDFTAAKKDFVDFVQKASFCTCSL